MEEKIGTARFVGDQGLLPKGIVRFEEYPLYNSEGFYIRDSEGNQIVINNIDWVMTIESGDLKGKEIDEVHVSYESILVYTKNGTVFRIDNDDLVDVLKKHNYQIKKKRTRTYISLKK